MSIPKPVILLSGPEDDYHSWEPSMRFRLTYEGPLRSVNRDPLDGKPDLLAIHKHSIRKVFHKQLKELWATDKGLTSYMVDPALWEPLRPINDNAARWGSRRDKFIPLSEALSGQYPSLNGFRFVPLVTERFALLCSLNILFLRRDRPGSAISAGDLDNRVKTIIDALRPPQKPNEFVGRDKQPIIPDTGEDPFFCLLEDDKQVSHISVETDTLLLPRTDGDEDLARAYLVITVEIRSYFVTMSNAGFL